MVITVGEWFLRIRDEQEKCKVKSPIRKLDVWATRRDADRKVQSQKSPHAHPAYWPPKFVLGIIVRATRRRRYLISPLTRAYYES